MPVEESVRDRGLLVVAFPGIRGKLNLPPDQFFEQADLSSASRIVVHDPSKRMLLGGVSPDFDSFEALLQFLRRRINEISPERLITTGTSGGAHSALLVGHLLKADRAVAFSPYPYLSLDVARQREDPAVTPTFRIAEAMDRLPGDVKKYFDLEDVLKEWNGHTEHHVHISRYNRQDRLRSRYLEGLPGLSIFSHPYRDHSVAGLLARDGRLAECFEFPYRHREPGLLRQPLEFWRSVVRGLGRSLMRRSTPLSIVGSILLARGATLSF